MNQEEISGHSRFYLVLAALLLAITIFGGIDLVLDAPDGVLNLHVVIEFAFVCACLATALYLGRCWIRARHSITRLKASLEAKEAERDEWRARAQKFLIGLGEAIDAQMRSWSLTDAERETALFLLKGFSHKEIAEITGKSERTVRQHSVAVYRKSGLSGRAELSAFFLEDLLLPSDRA